MYLKPVQPIQILTVTAKSRRGGGMCAANNKSKGRMCASAGCVCVHPLSKPGFLNGRVPSVKVVLDRAGICRRAPI